MTLGVSVYGPDEFADQTVQYLRYYSDTSWAYCSDTCGRFAAYEGT